MLKGTYYALYKKISEKTGQRITVFKYAVTGSEAELEKYKAALEANGQPCHLEEDNETHKGKIIFFTPTHSGAVVDLSISRNNAIFVTDDASAILESKLSTVSDPALKAAMAQMIAAQILGTAPAAPVAAPVVAEPTEAVASEPADLES
jgi:hypothetical protein